jgi:hypothetical protein
MSLEEVEELLGGGMGWRRQGEAREDKGVSDSLRGYDIESFDRVIEVKPLQGHGPGRADKP